MQLHVAVIDELSEYV